MSFYEKTGTSASGMNHRRTWDSSTYSLAAQKRLNDEQEALDIASGKKKKDHSLDEFGNKIKRDMLQARDYKVDLDSKVGKSVVINKATPSAETGGFYCNVCDCVVKDSINFLDHINGKNHQRNMGMSMKIKKSTVDDVKNRFKQLKEQKEKEKKEKQVESMLEDVKEEEMKMSDYKKSKKHDGKARKRKHDEDEEDGGDELDPELREMMGFGSFGGPKK